jgi:hypothetical protein
MRRKRCFFSVSLSPCLLVSLSVLVLAGCGGGPYKTARVSGRITLNGQPLSHAAITFQPIGSEGNLNPGAGSGAFTDSDGRYLLKLIGQDNEGAVVTKHKVRITLTRREDSADDRPKRYKEIPARYNGKTKLEFDVPAGGTDSANFDLTSP